MQKRRDDIMDTAERLFNQRGYNSVSLRDIADELSISKGNLTYYFQKKEDLIEACVVRAHTGYTKPKTPESLNELMTFLTMLIKKKAERPYYFQNYSQLAELCPKVNKIQCSIIEDFADIIHGALQNLMASDIIRQDCASAYLGIVQSILTIITYGIVPVGKQNVDEQINCIWSILTPCLTELGRRQCQKK